MVGEEPAIFFRRDDKLGIGKDARGPGDSVPAGTGAKARTRVSYFRHNLGLSFE